MDSSNYKKFKFDFIELMILLFSSLAIVFITSEIPILVKLAPIVGLINQPFWVYKTYKDRNIGMFIVSIIYVFSWGYSFYLNWIH